VDILGAPLLSDFAALGIRDTCQQAWFAVDSTTIGLIAQEMGGELGIIVAIFLLMMMSMS